MKKAILLILLCSVFQMANAQDSLYLNFKQELFRFAKNYKPLYIIGRDTLVVPTYRKPNKSLNEYMLQCAVNEDYRLLFCCVIILRKQQTEYIKKSNQDYILDDPDYSNIGYLEMIRTFLRIEKNDSTYIEPIYSGELLHMLFEKRAMIKNYPE